MKINKKPAIFLLAALILAFCFGFFQNVLPAKAEESIEELQDEEKSLQKELEKAEKEHGKLSQQYQQIQNSITAVHGEIVKTTEKINVAEEQISRKESSIAEIENRIDFQKKVLQSLIRETYYAKSSPAFDFIMVSDNFRKILSGADNASVLEEKILLLVGEIKEDKEKLESEKEGLARIKSENEKVLMVKQSQKKDLVEDKIEAEEDIQEAQATIHELQEKLAELKSDLNRILGKSYDTGEIKDAIRFASKITGVREGFLFGMLSMESGGNPLAGRCTYKNCSMRSDRKKKFKEICDYLGYNTKKCESMPLSCASKSYPGSGGAMGAAQFMSDTWMGYKNRIASAIGDDKPNPWELLDGVVAMALYLDDLGATNSGKISIKNPCSGKSVKVKWEIYASMRYLGWTCYGYTNYAPGVQSLANGYKNL